ncbi:unnamed protein product [Penicillium nalgiovense]|uniref:Uncharacterized protein n=1 Tax=Penicillium nalgiovense TaxID=60175 RepID=A0A9W4MV83_PENNA|nr:unnamed protein product [Penicillium nalgiovense]CAG7964223.1 unnamed protein product [Penicillium nalgiovense]CAG7978457.1 unnamed protein product [Penicillium nalgiovense]CAG8004634.1 unnamed protein product [Penicillium nalgiovense]CAG8018081.1 unnamed protein product [Penicillium nalgiovense]
MLSCYVRPSTRGLAAAGARRIGIQKGRDRLAAFPLCGISWPSGCEISPIRQPEQDPARGILSRPPAREESPMSDTFIPRQIPVFPSQIPQRSSRIPSRCSRSGGSAARNTPVPSHNHSQESRVPGTIPRRESEFPTPRPEEPSERTQDTVADPSDSDSDSTSSVYTAPEGDINADVVSRMNHQSGPYEMPA